MTAAYPPARTVPTPSAAVERWLGLVMPGEENAGRRAVIVVLAGWAPLLLFALAESSVDFLSVLRETGVHARYLIAAPILVLAGKACARKLDRVVREFVDRGLVQDADQRRFEDAVARARSLARSPAAAVAVIAAAYLVTAGAVVVRLRGDLPEWVTSDATPIYSLAGWWHGLISLPLLLALLLGWLWRLVAWTRLLRLVARLDLRLVGAHPDRCGGLAFVGASVRAFAPVAFGVGAIMAGRWAHVVLMGATSAPPHEYFAGLILLVLVLFVAPVCVFAPMLKRESRRANFEYGALATRLGLAFERKWFDSSRVDDGAHDKSDFSAEADFHAIASSARSIRLVPVGHKDIVVLGYSILLPFLPVAIAALPLKDIFTKFLTGLLF